MSLIEEPMSRHEQWMRLAIQLAQKAKVLGEVPVGAVVVKDDCIVGEGWNRPISSNDPTAHAELTAIRDAANRLNNYRLPGCVLYVTIEPCTMCAGGLVHSRVDAVVYGATEPKAGAVISQNKLFEHPAMNARIESLGGVCEDECRQLISDFFAERRLQKKHEKQARLAQQQEEESKGKFQVK